MPSYDNMYNEEAKVWAKFKKNTNQDAILRAWREEYKRKGIIEFALKELRVDPKNGGTLKFSDEQKQFLIDVSEGRTKFAIISAGRGTGKSFSLSVLIAWFIFVTEYSNIGVLAGNSKQSGVLDEYIKGWIKLNPKLASFCLKNVESKIITGSQSSVVFCALSDTAVRGIHGSILIIDEEVAAEEAGGEDIVKTAEWTVNTAKNMVIIRSSTPQSSGGYFIETWNQARKRDDVALNKEHDYVRYQWSSVRHISGNKDPYMVYKDTTLSHWFSNLPWISDDNIRKIRKDKSNDEWLAEALGVMSLSSGLVFNPADITYATCKECKECVPYQGYCIMLQAYLMKEGYVVPEIIPPDGICEDCQDPEIIRLNEITIRNALRKLGERSLGIDWGDKAPDCYNVLAKYNNQTFVLDSAEYRGQGTDDKIGTAEKLRDKWVIETVVPDPEQWAYSEALANLDFNVVKIWSGGGLQDKQKFVMWLKKDFERGRIHIPKAFTWLLKSLSELTYGDDGKIVKRNDHSFDSLLYGRSYYGAVEEDEVANLKNMFGARIWNNKDEPQAPNEYTVEIPISKPKLKMIKTNRDEEEESYEERQIRLIEAAKDFNPFDENYLRRRKAARYGEDFADFDGGVSIW